MVRRGSGEGLHVRDASDDDIVVVIGRIALLQEGLAGGRPQPRKKRRP